MRPLPYGSGKGTSPRENKRDVDGFNEAAPLRKRKVRESIARSPAFPCFNEAAPLRKRKAALAKVRRPVSASLQ